MTMRLAHLRNALAALVALCGVFILAAGQVAEARGPESVADVADELLGSVVNISTSQTVQGSRNVPVPDLPPGSPFEEFFREFFDQNQDEGRPRRVSSLGSGFVIDPTGIIVTNNHVIAEADEITVNFSDGTKLEAEVIGRDPKTDIAVLRVESDKPLPAVRFGSSEALRTGDWVLAIGNPFGLGGTVTTGIVSAMNRDINAGPYDSFIQTDAAINRGNSGGPLFNMDGEVIGINTAIISPTGGSIGIGFAIPSSLARPIIDQLVQFGETRRGFIGVRIQLVTDEIADSLGMDTAEGALVAGVTPDGPAAQAGVQTGDIILSFNGQEITDHRRLSRVVADTPVGSTTQIEVLRNGERVELDITLGRLEESERTAMADSEPGSEEDEAAAPPSLSVFGMELGELTDENRRAYDVDEAINGVVVLSVEDGSVAAERQISEGQLIMRVGQESVTSPKEIGERIDELRERGSKSALLFVGNNKGDGRFVVLPLDE